MLLVGKQFPILWHLVDRGCVPAITSYLEIGVNEGDSFRQIIQENPTIDRVVLCDDWGKTHGGAGRGNHRHIELLLEEIAFPKENVTFLNGDSKETIPHYWRSHGEEIFDLVFIDGDHSCKGFLTDLLNVRDHAWMIVVHDARMAEHDLAPNIRALFYRFCETPIARSKFIILDDNNDLCVLIHRDRYGL